MRCHWNLLGILLTICVPFVSTGCGPSYMSEDAAIEEEEEGEQGEQGEGDVVGDGGAVDEGATGTEETISC